MEEQMTDEDENPREAELARLADRTLPAEREAELRAEVQRSPELTARLAEQERAVTLLRALDQPAPAALHARINELTGAGRPRRRAPRWRRVLVLPGATAVAVAVALVVIVLGGSTAPTVPQTARLALAAATLPAPGVDGADTSLLTLKSAGIPFPNWGLDVATRWKTTGARADTVDGRQIKTVFYVGHHGERIGYAIASGAPLSGVTGGSTVMRYGVAFTLAHQGSSRLITWVRGGHTCVIAGRSVSFGTLLALASADEQVAR
jgi:hypothetical protein